MTETTSLPTQEATPATGTGNPVVAKKGMSTGVKVLIGCGALIVLSIICFLVASALGLAGLSKVSTEITNNVQQSETDEKNAFENPSKLGEAVTVDDVQWTLVSAKDIGSSLKSTYSYGDDCVSASGKFVRVEVKAKNNSAEKISVYNLYLYDSAKSEYSTSTDVSSCSSDDLFFLESINPGIEKTFVAIYEVPKTSSSFKLKVGDVNIFSLKHKYISLGF